jgi:mRNA interferase HigB
VPVVDIEGVTGSIPVTSTILPRQIRIENPGARLGFASKALRHGKVRFQNVEHFPCSTTGNSIQEIMRLIARSTVLDYAAKHPTATAALSHWLTVVKEARWATTAEAAEAFSKAKSVGGHRIRYDLVGGDYRLIVAFDFRRQIAFGKFIGTRAEYDRIDAETIEQF